MNTKQKKALYESIMKNVSKTVKKQLNESETVDEYKIRMNNYINNWFETAFHTGDENHAIASNETYFRIFYHI